MESTHLYPSRPLKDHTIKSFEIENFPFNGKSVFHHKDGTQHAWFSQSPEK